MAKEIVELVRDHLCGEDKALEELLLIQALSGSQGGGAIDPTTLVLLLAATNRKSGGRFENLALLTVLLQQQQQAQAAACSTTGVPVPPPATNALPAVLALGLIDRPKGEIREFRAGGYGDLQHQLDEMQEQIDQLNEKLGGAVEIAEAAAHRKPKPQE